MSWWSLPGRHEDMIGDEPADLVTAALGRAAALRGKTAGPAPALAELLGALSRAIAEASSELEDPPRSGSRVVAFTSAADIEPGPSGEDLVAPLADGIREAAARYHERFKRNPRLVELLALFAFVLRPDHPELDDLGIR